MAAGPPNLNDWYSRQGMQVKAGSLTLAGGGHIKAGQTAYNAGTGFFLGFDGSVPKLSIGNVASGHYLSWDGSTLTVRGNITVSSVTWSSVTGAGKPADNADVTVSAVNGGLTVTGGGITLSGGGSIKGGQTGYDTGTGFFLGYSGGYKFSIGNSAGTKITWDGSNLNVTAYDVTISGGLTVGGTKTSTSLGGAGAAIVANDSQNSLRGLISVANSTAQAIVAYQLNSGGVALYAYNGGGGIALEVLGKLTLDNNTFTWNSYVFPAPTGSTTTYMRNDGTWSNPLGGLTIGTSSGQIPVSNGTTCTNLNAQFLQGYTPSSFQAAGSYATASHDHSGFQSNGLNIFNITTNTARDAQYSSDGGVTWNSIQLKFL